uniref:Retrotransposon gag domain-containing protein n=1 Tax=Chara braunii TaxID=69332 RepID=A0A388LSW9_CHABU
MPETGGPSVVPKKGLTLDDLIAAIDRHERDPSNIPKVDTFHFCGERVSEWLERVEQALVGRSDIVKFQCILQYVLHNYHQEVKKVIEAAQGSWERFNEGMQRKYRLGDGLLTTADLEAMNKEDFTTIGAFVQEFKKRARKVHGISEEAQCAIFLGLHTASEAVELTRHGGGSTKLTWATIDRGVKVGCLDQVEQRQVRLQRQKRKERDATASGTPGVTRIVTDVLAQLGYATEPVVQRRVVTAVKVKGKEPVIEEAVQEELWEEEEPVPQHLTKVQRKVRNLAQGGQGSRKAQAPQTQAAAPLNVAAPSSSTGPSQGWAPSYGQWP